MQFWLGLCVICLNLARIVSCPKDLTKCLGVWEITAKDLREITTNFNGLRYKLHLEWRCLGVIALPPKFSLFVLLFPLRERLGSVYDCYYVEYSIVVLLVSAFNGTVLGEWYFHGGALRCFDDGAVFVVLMMALSSLFFVCYYAAGYYRRGRLCRFGALRQGDWLVSPALPSREELAPCYSIRRA
jgi:hypothetical protein